jgi:hypothetical protein
MLVMAPTGSGKQACNHLIGFFLSNCSGIPILASFAMGQFLVPYTPSQRTMVIWMSRNRDVLNAAHRVALLMGKR